MGEQGEEINQIYADMRAEIQRLEERGYTDCILAEIMKARRRAELLKVNSFIDLASEAYENGRSVCIFVNFVDTLRAIYSRLVKKFGAKLVSKIHGGQKSSDRDIEIAKFQSDVSRFMVSNIQAGGVSVSLHDLNGNYPRVSYISPTYSAVLLRQVTGRIHRNGGMTDCLQYIVFCKGTIEETVCYKVSGKLKSMDLINDGDLCLDMREFYSVEFDLDSTEEIATSSSPS
jgi:superfamily II DNA or RNA helicase